MTRHRRIFLLIALLLAAPASAGVDVLVIDGGNEIDYEAGSTEGFPRLGQSDTPPAGECNDAAESGRLYMDTDSVVGAKLQVCSGAAGWEDMFATGGFMREADYVTVYGYPWVDFAAYGGGVDTNGNAVYEIECPGGACNIDADEDGFNEMGFFPGFEAILYDPDSDGNADFAVNSPLIGSGSITTQFRFSDGIGVGRPDTDTNGTISSACVGRDNGPDKLFEDKDCDFPAVITPETTPTGTTNAEPFLTDMQRRLSADFTTATTTATPCTSALCQVTNLKLDLDWIGAYWIEFQLLTQSTVVTTGMSFGVEYTGTETSLYCTRTYQSTGAGAGGTTGNVDDVAATNTGQLVEHMSANVASTLVPNLGPTAGVAVVDSTALETIRCNLLTTTTGDLQLWVAAETANTVRVMANSMVKATPFP